MRFRLRFQRRGVGAGAGLRLGRAGRAGPLRMKRARASSLRSPRPLGACAPLRPARWPGQRHRRRLRPRGVEQEEPAPRGIPGHAPALEESLGPEGRFLELASSTSSVSHASDFSGPSAPVSKTSRRMSFPRRRRWRWRPPRRRLHQERARLLLRRLGGPHEGVDELAEVSERAAPLEEPDEPFERLAEQRIGVERGQVIARGARLVAGALLELTDLAEQPRLAGFLARVGELRPELGDRTFDSLLARGGRRRRLATSDRRRWTPSKDPGRRLDLRRLTRGRL